MYGAVKVIHANSFVCPDFGVGMYCILVDVKNGTWAKMSLRVCSQRAKACSNGNGRDGHVAFDSK